MTAVSQRRPDRRRERTQRLLADALLGLIAERNYDEIRIEDICHRADLGRATFYLHYNNKEELLFAALERILSREHSLNLEKADSKQRSLSLAQHAFEHVVAYRMLYRSLSSSTQSGSIDRQLRGFLEKIIHAEMRHIMMLNGLDMPEPTLHLVVVYLASALHGIMMWAANLEGDIDVERLSMQYYAFTDAGFRALITADVPN